MFSQAINVALFHSGWEVDFWESFSQTFRIASYVFVEKFASFNGRTNKGVMLKQDYTVICKNTGIFKRQYFGHFSSDLGHLLSPDQ